LKVGGRGLQDFDSWEALFVAAAPKPPTTSPTSPVLLHMQEALNPKPALRQDYFKRIKITKEKNEFKEALALRVTLSLSVPRENNDSESPNPSSICLQSANQRERTCHNKGKGTNKVSRQSTNTTQAIHLQSIPETAMIPTVGVVDSHCSCAHPSWCTLHGDR
jgi:hypothetical protein